MCLHNWALFGDEKAKPGDRFFFRCRRCRAVVSLGVAGGVLHANVHGELGPIVGAADVQALVDSVVNHFRPASPVRKKSRKKAA